MHTNMNNNWYNNKTVKIIGVIGSLIAIFSFFTGKDHLKDIFSNKLNTISNTIDNSNSKHIKRLKISIANGTDESSLAKAYYQYLILLCQISKFMFIGM